MRHAIALTSVAALLALSAPAFAQGTTGQNGRYCLKMGSGSQTENCAFNTMAACEKAKTGQADTCAANPKMTTGSSSDMKDKKR